MWTIQLARKTITADTTIGNHNEATGTMDHSLCWFFQRKFLSFRCRKPLQQRRAPRTLTRRPSPDNRPPREVRLEQTKEVPAHDFRDLGVAHAAREQGCRDEVPVEVAAQDRPIVRIHV